VVLDHTTTIVAKDEIIYELNALKFMLINSGGEWAREFDNLFKMYGMHH
jgi:hypothetical protein